MAIILILLTAFVLAMWGFGFIHASLGVISLFVLAFAGFNLIEKGRVD